MREAHPVERAVGMAYYVSDAPGVGGHLRESPEDFRVTEVEAFEPDPLDADAGAYPNVLARVTLRGWDTNDFASELSDRLGISRERVSWAGTKDKHAVTTQLFSVAKADPDEVRAVEIRDAEVELLGRTGRPVLFGDLAGNAFEITVRGVDEPEHADATTSDLRAFASGDDAAESGDPDAAADEPATVGVPNYFGQQRFGSKRPVTHEVGLEILRGDWKGAVLAYVGSPAEREPESTREARAYVDETEDWAGALDRLPKRLGFERSMCHRLVERQEERGGEGEGDGECERGDDGLTDEDYRAALEAVPSNLQRLFVNAAQSYAFNRMLSERLERGLPFHEPVAGDVVCFADSEAPEGVALPDTDRTQRVTEDRLRTVRRHCERGRAFVTAPLVGTETDLADGEMGEIERAVLDDLDLDPADFDLPGEFESTGTRRAVLLRTELSVDRAAPDRDGDDADDADDTDGALAFEFTLPKGSYATVVLREYLKRDPDDL
ncbi:tRNA pseudouridine(13) synthase TruD [Halosimplex pelagicum]|uniref:Probable tRNA pseudouridine synthase D n=1 Tax=Halosimplex pelagicum TaxID=869886 RepID=A0A7D5T9J4_9EURY|nr:tRNA pseudouridine(13) synthase TruD [Halosimplex pelagicum]QLH81950.1 tRNA pseudouridine(13) synthase TruD [Halosimplex pelagicum]